MATRRSDTDVQAELPPDLPTDLPGLENGAESTLPPAFESPFANMDGPAGLSESQITGAMFDTQARAEAHAVMTAPAGDYIKTARWTDTFKRSHRVGDCVAGDTYPHGRVVYTISGKPDVKTVNGVNYQPVLFVRLSPDRRPHAVNPGEFDLLYKIFDRVCETFLAVEGRELRGEEDLQRFLEEGEYTLNTMVQDDGRLMILNVKKTLKPGERRYQRR